MWIELSEFNLKILILFIFPIFKRVEEYPRKAFLTKDNQLFKTFRYFLSYNLSFIPFLIIKIRTRKRKNRKEKKINESENLSDNNDDIIIPKSREKSEVILLSQKVKKRKRINNIIFILVLCSIAIFCYYFSYVFNSKDKKYEYLKQSVGVFFNIFEYIALSFFILKQKLYKHNFISSGIIALMLLILFIDTIFYMESKYIFPSFIYYIFYALVYGSYDVLKKKFMITFYSSPYFLMFVIGIIDMIALLIFESFIHILDLDIDGIAIGFQNNISSSSKFFIFVSHIILQWVWNIGIWLTIYYLTPCHYFISQYFSEYIYYILKAKDNNDDFYSLNNIILFSIASFINFVCTLIFNEVIILNFCGLDYNTRKRIQQRESKDILGMLDGHSSEFDNHEEEEENRTIELI